jgi:PPM family protein phosphatase
MTEGAAPDGGFEIAALTDVGTEREHNEDACGTLIEGPARGVLAVADGVSGSEGGETASRMAVESVLRSFTEQGEGTAAARRLARAVQSANIEVYELSLAVPELHGMATTLTAVTLDRGELSVAHVGDSRLYLLREGKLTQLTKDHTVAAEQVRLGVLSEARARKHPGRSVLTRSLGRELIVSLDRISLAAQQGDSLLVCSDGLYNVLDDREIASLLAEAGSAQDACKALIEAANARGTYDNITAAVARIRGAVAKAKEPAGIGARLRRLFGG